MAEIVYVLCALLSVVCAALLIRKYRDGRSRLLLWSGLSFSLLAINNLVLFIDMLVLPDVDFGGPLIRVAAGALAGLVLLFGLIWEVT